MTTSSPSPTADGAGGRPRVGVLVAVRDGEAHLAAALDSVQAQTRTDWCCVVVDDGSTDGTAAVARRYAEADARVVLVAATSRSGTGAGAARNRGMRRLPSSVDLLAFLDADDTWLPDALERLVRVLGATPGAVGAYGTAEYMDAAGRPLLPGAHPARQRDRRRVRGLDLAAVPVDEPRTTHDALVVSGPVWPAAVVLLRRDVVDRVGGFDERLHQCEDWDLYLRCSRHGDLLFHDAQVAWYRRHDANATGDAASSEHHQDVVRRRARVAADATPAQRWAAERAWRAVQHRRVARTTAGVVAGARARDGVRVRAAGRRLVRETADLVRRRSRLPAPPAPQVRGDDAPDPVTAPLGGGGA